MNITLPRATVEQALECLKGVARGKYDGSAAGVCAALEAALAQQAEPVPPFPPVSQWNQGCAVCGIGADGKAYGYVCPRHDCPTKVTCGGVA